jgi:glycosyltransferase involved in cell wall biosynthesis
MRSDKAVRPRARVFYPAVDLVEYDRQSGASERWSSAQGPVRFVYAGALGHSYDVEAVIRCARQLSQKMPGAAEFHIAGSGPKRESLGALAEGLSNVTFHGWLNGAQLAGLLARSHVALAPYRPGATQSVTYKLFDYAAAGLPILSSLPGEMASLLEQEAIGHDYAPGDDEALLRMMESLVREPSKIRSMGERARRFAEAHGDSRVVYRQMAEFLTQTTITRQ